MLFNVKLGQIISWKEEKRLTRTRGRETLTPQDTSFGDILARGTINNVANVKPFHCLILWNTTTTIGAAYIGNFTTPVLGAASVASLGWHLVS